MQLRHARSPPQSQIPASQVLVSPTAGSKPLRRGRSLPKSPSTGFVHTPFRCRSPRDLDVPLPEPTPRSPHLGPCSPGQGGGDPRRRSQRPPAAPFYMVARGRPRRVYAGGLGPMAVSAGASRGRRESRPFKSLPRGRGRMPTDGRLDQSELGNDLA